MPAWAPSLVARHRCHGPKRSSPRRGRELEPRNGVLRSDSGPVVARFDAGERLMGSAQSEVPAPGPCWLPVGYRTPTALVDLDRAVDVGWGPSPVGPTSGAGSPMPRPDEAVREASEARARGGGRMLRRGTSRPGGPSTGPAPRSADLDGRIGGGIKKYGLSWEGDVRG